MFKNSIYAFLMQAVALVFALFTSPYVSRVLGADGLGRVNFSAAVAGWFSIFAMFGTSIYGVRAVVKVRDDKEALSKLVSELLIIKAIATVIALVSLAAAAFSVPNFAGMWQLFLVQGLMIFINILSVDWFFQGLEDYRFIAIRNIAFKLVALVAIFLVIRNPEDYILYAVIALGTISFSNILNIFYLRKKIRFGFKEINIKKHFKPLIFFLYTALLLNIFMMLDQTLLGFLRDEVEVALLHRARMFWTIGLVVTTSISAAILPNLCKSYEDDKKEYFSKLAFSRNLILFFAFPISAGIFFLAPHLMLLFGNEEFMAGTTALRILAVTIPFGALGGWNYNQRVVISGEEKKGTIILFFTAVASLALNIIFIPFWGLLGAVISFLICEILSNMVWFIFSHHKDKFRIFTPYLLIYIIAGFLMLGALFGVSQIFEGYTWTALIVLLITGVVIYFVVLIILREQNIIAGLRFLKARLKRNQMPEQRGEANNED